MKRVAVVAGLLAAAGCKSILGLDPVVLDDGGPADADPNNPRIRLTWQIAKTKDQGFTDPVLEYAPLDPPPLVQLGSLDGPLEDAPYGPDGTVRYPIALAGRPWRLVYTLADGVPREVQWSPPDGDLVAHIVEPLLGRAQRLAVPPGGGYAITPVASPAQHTLTRVFTTGIWTEGVISSPPAGARLDYDFGARAQSLSGPLGAPEKAFFDHAVLTDFQNVNGCRKASGVAAFTVPDMAAGSLTPPETQPTYHLADEQVTLELRGPDPVATRLQTALGSRTGGAILNRMEYGYVPSLGVFGFAKPAAAPSLEFYLPGPTMISLASCAFPSGMLYTTQPFADPPELRGRFPRVVHVEVASQRTVAGGLVTLTSGFSAVQTATGNTFASEFLVPAPTAITLHRSGVQIADLGNDADGSLLLTGTGPLELRFEVESLPTLRADYFEIALHAIASSRLELKRVYMVTERRLTIDPAVLAPGTEHVLQIRSYHGRPDVARGSFAVSTYPQYAAAIFTRTFKTP